MMVAESRAIALVIFAVWCFAAVATAFSYKLAASWANIVISLVIVSTAVITLGKLLSRRPLPIDHVTSSAGSTIWTVSALPGALTVIAVIVCAIAATCLSFRVIKRKGWGLWLAWVLNGPGVLTGVASAALSFPA
jgi:hypothetical protein